MLNKKNIHIIGTGTIGLPLIGLFARHKEKFNIGEVTFHKNTPLLHDLANVRQLLKAGAKLTTDKDKFDKFRELGIEPAYDRVGAIDNADVVIDCTPSGQASKHKKEYYSPRYNTYYNAITGEKIPAKIHKNKETLFIAQGSEKGFGKIFAHGINNEALKVNDYFLQVASCNTHAGAAIIKTLSNFGKHLKSDLVYIRRSNDISQNTGCTPSIEVGDHTDDSGHGTHHAVDIHDLFKTVNNSYNITSSACKINSQLMHTMRFNITIDNTSHTFGQELTKEDVMEALSKNDKIALTHHKTANKVYSHGREFGYYGRILNQVVIPAHTIDISQVKSSEQEEGSKVYNVKGFAYTPQDGNSLLSSVAAALWHINDKNWNKVDKKLKHLEEYLFDIV